MAELDHTYTQTLAAPPPRVFAALTDAAQLRLWFAEHAVIEPHVGGAYRFWGRHTYGAPSREEATQSITALEPDTALGFTWHLENRDSDVRITLTPDSESDGTKLTVRHRFAEAPAIGRAREMVDDLWRLHCGNLAAHLTGGEVMRPDFADPSPRVEVSIVIDAPRERVFRALTDPEVMNRWISSAAEVDPREGGRYSYGWKYQIDGSDVAGGPTRIVEYVENERLVTDWPDWRGDPSVPPTTVTWLLRDEGEGRTRVTLVHGTFPRTTDISDYPFGWGWFLSQLKSTAEAKT